MKMHLNNIRINSWLPTTNDTGEETFQDACGIACRRGAVHRKPQEITSSRTKKCHNLLQQRQTLITGEYAVLDGAKALALPTKYGQDLIVETGTRQTISLESLTTTTKYGLKTRFHLHRLQNCNFGNKLRDTLLTILHQAFAMNPTMENEPDLK
jgi:hypothetical protein